ncbi:MAG: peptide ABC transporter substrate-binding protein [bacterium]|nr:peptide ABC transporter substrate-binding protein [bacterium]MCP5069601.1 peptide ABC transporter substrate-binding protein [bacterium]
MRSGLGLLVLPLLALLGIGLTFRASFHDPADFTFVNGTEPNTLDPGLMTGEPEGRIASALFEGLTIRDPATLRPAPGVAERWEISADGRRYVFHLRRDARWTDGLPVTAHDFAYAWRRLQLPEHGGEYAYIMHGVRGAEALNRDEARAIALRGPVRAAVEGLVQGAIDPQVWEELVAEQDLVTTVRGTRDPVLRAGLEAPPVDRAAFLNALAGEAERRSARASEARLHYGIDLGVHARDDYTLVVELVAAIPYFLELTAFYPAYPVPRKLLEAPGNERDWFLPEKIVSNGPFELAAWRIGDRIRLRRSDSYWNRESIPSRTIDALPLENVTTALNLYLSGEVDWIPRYPSDLVDALRERSDHYAHAGFITYYYRINTRRPPLDDARVRRALALAIDREMIVSEVLRLGELPALHLVPPGIPGYEPPPTAVGFDPERARTLLAEAGFPGGEGFPEIGILYNTLESHKKIAELIADQLARHLGIVIKPYNQEWQSYLATMRAGDYDLGRAGWIGDYLDPNTFLDLWVTNGGNNQTGWSHPVYDRLIAAARNVDDYVQQPFVDGLAEPGRLRVLLAAAAEAPDVTARREALAALRLHLLREAERILVEEELPILPIYFYVVNGLVRPEVEGFYTELVQSDGQRLPNLQNLHPLRSIHLPGSR